MHTAGTAPRDHTARRSLLIAKRRVLLCDTYTYHIVRVFRLQLLDFGPKRVTCTRYSFWWGLGGVVPILSTVRTAISQHMYS